MIVLLSGYITIKSFLGYHTKVLGVEYNIPVPEEKIVYNPVPYTEVKTKEDNTESDAEKLPKQAIDNKNKQTSTTVAKNVVNGFNFGQVGDNYINTQNLTEQDKQSLMLFIGALKKRDSVDFKCAIIQTTQTSNGGKIASQIGDFLTQNGISVNGNGISFSDFKGVRVDHDGACYVITVGTLQ